jgi:hypothetical protein
MMDELQELLAFSCPATVGTTEGEDGESAVPPLVVHCYLTSLKLTCLRQSHVSHGSGLPFSMRMNLEIA